MRVAASNAAFALLALACAPGSSRLELKAAGAGEVAPIVLRELADARKNGRDVLVYVGASWCEPCERFHAAAKAGQLDAALPKLRLLEFDADADRDRLTRAGYVSRLIPLFVRPSPTGRSSGQQIEGSVKGDAAVAEITPRLQALLNPPASQ